MSLISTNTLPLNRYGSLEQIVKLIKDCGFDAYDFTMYGIAALESFIDKDNYASLAKDFRKYADSIGIVCNQSHSFFPTIKLGNEEWNEKGMFYTRRAIEVAGILGAKYCVVHPCNDMSAEQNAGTYNALKQTAKDSGVKIALENMWNWNAEEDHAIRAACSDEVDFNKHLDVLSDDGVFVACLDIGHAEMKGLNTSAVKMIKSLGSRLKCIHLHDNDRHHDSHRLPFTYGIDFEPIIDALAEIKYDGDITFEADWYPAGFPTALYPQAMRLMREVGDYFRREIEKRK